EFVRQIRLRALGDFESLPSPGADVQYFPPDLVTVAPDECFVDCGAYNGDSLSDFLDHCGGDFRRVIAFEPDPVNLAGLQKRVQDEGMLCGRAAIYSAVVGAANGTVQFNANGLASASLCEGDGLAVSCVALEDILSAEEPTFIKMDIEGAELDALAGAQECI